MYNELQAISIKVNKLKNRINEFIEGKKEKDLQNHEQKRLERFM